MELKQFINGGLGLEGMEVLSRAQWGVRLQFTKLFDHKQASKIQLWRYKQDQLFGICMFKLILTGFLACVHSCEAISNATRPKRS